MSGYLPIDPFASGSTSDRLAAAQAAARQYIKADRAAAVERAAKSARLVDPAYTQTLEQIRTELESQSAGWTARRAAKLQLADYMSEVGRAEVRPDILESAREIRECREHGFVGLTADGVMKAWDHKCEQVRLCPDEARDEQARLIERYAPNMLAWVKGDPRRRLQYAVFTWPNVPDGELAWAKSAMFEAFQRRILKAKYQAAPVEWGYVQGRRVAKRTRKRTIPKFPAIKGALVVQEDPLAAAGADHPQAELLGTPTRDVWNVHLNVVLAIEGDFDWSELRQEWGWNVHLQAIERDEKALVAALRELIKYSAQIVAEKSDEKAASGRTKAPPMTEWPAPRFCEWFDAQQAFRRTRSYGCWYGMPLEPPTLDLSDVEWIGEVQWDQGSSRFLVDLIRGDKSRSWGASNTQPGADYAPEMTSRPPPRPPDWGDPFRC